MKYFTIVGGINKGTLRDFYRFVEKQKAGDEVCINISSDGGDPDVALAMVGIMSATGLIWTTQAFGYAYSAAVLIFCAGSVRRVSRAAFFMVHESSEKVKGDTTTVKRKAKHMERTEEHWNSLMELYTKTSAAHWAKLSERDTYINAEEALKLGIATEIIK